MKVAHTIGVIPIVLKFLEKLLDLETKMVCVFTYFSLVCLCKSFITVLKSNTASLTAQHGEWS